MSTLEEKLEEIDKKVVQLVEQNTQYKKICEELLAVRRKLEAENKELKSKLKGNAEKVETLETHTAKLKLAYRDDTEELKKQINQYIQDIDTSIEWLKEL